MPAAAAVSLPHNHCDCSASRGRVTSYLHQIILWTSGKLILVPVAGNQLGTSALSLQLSWYAFNGDNEICALILVGCRSSCAGSPAHCCILPAPRAPPDCPLSTCLPRPASGRPPPDTRARGAALSWPQRSGFANTGEDRALVILCCTNEHISTSMHLRKSMFAIIICDLVDVYSEK